MPRYQRVITIEEDVNELKFYGNFMNSVSLQGSTIIGKVTTRDQVVNALHLRPDRLIVGEIRGKEANEILSGANFGVPFMTTMHSGGNGQAVLNRLQSKPMCVEPQTLSMLDVAVFMKQSSLASRSVESIVEYKWLSRDVNELESGCEMKIAEISRDSAMADSGIDCSKVLLAYSKEHLLSLARVKKELKLRASYLKGLLECDGNTNVPDYISGYNEIK